jgi:pescadillo protein
VIHGQQITWIVPYQYPSKLPIDVDYRVMLTFLEFYEVLVKFINFKLYQELNIQYPPDVNAVLEDKASFCYRALALKN